MKTQAQKQVPAEPRAANSGLRCQSSQMATIGESSSILPKLEDEKPVIVRIKRKASQSRLDAFWLEINERPLKRPLFDFENLSISESPGKEASKTKKVLVQHVETLRSSETFDIVQSVVESASYDKIENKAKRDEHRRHLKATQRQEQLLAKARKEQEILGKNARFEQIWRRRKETNEPIHKFHEMCHFYDILRVEEEQRSDEVSHQGDMSLEDQRILSSYLPLLREFIPNAAAEVESDIHSYLSGQASTDDYVYDLYTVKSETKAIDEDAFHPFPLIQVEDDDYYDGPDESEYETDDSNAENNPLNDYPDEMSEEEEESESEDSDDKSEDNETDSASEQSSEAKNSELHDLAEDDEQLYDGESNDAFAYDDCDEGDWRLSYR